MHPLLSQAYNDFSRELNRIARSEPVQSLKKETIVRVLDFARSVPAVFDPTVSVKKGKQATVKGAVTIAIAAVIYAALRGALAPIMAKIGLEISPDQEQAIVGIIALAIGSIGNGVIAWFANWKKHRDDV